MDRIEHHRRMTKVNQKITELEFFFREKVFPKLAELCVLTGYIEKNTDKLKEAFKEKDTKSSKSETEEEEK